MNKPLPILTCEGCGACCLTMGHPRYFWNQEQGITVDQIWIELPRYLIDQLEAHLESLDGNDEADFGSPCIWFDQAKLNCRHHPHRPQICRDLEVGGEACIRSRRQLSL